MAPRVFAVKAGCSGPVSLKGSDPTKTVDRDPRHDSKTQTAGFQILHPTPPSLLKPVSQRITGAIIPARFGAPRLPN
jgi:hypothetical protein